MQSVILSSLEELSGTKCGVGLVNNTIRPGIGSIISGSSQLENSFGGKVGSPPS